MNILIKNGTVVSPSDNLNKRADVLIKDGVIAAIEENIDPALAERCIDATGKTVMPGFIDLHTHLREPGQEGKETVATGTRAAAAGGYTAVACMPNTSPVNDSAMITRFILQQAAEAGYARVYPIASVSKGSQGTELSEMGRLVEAGARGFSDDGKPVENSNLMRLAMIYASQFGTRIYSHCEEMSLVNGGSMNEGEVCTRLGLRAISRAAEETMIARDIVLAHTYNVPVHLCHVSTAFGASMIAAAKKAGIPVTAETAPHYLFGTDELCDGYNTMAKVNPPLRTDADREALAKALVEGTIDCIATDHAPHKADDKDKEFDHAAFGISGIETAFALSYTSMVKTGKTDISGLVNMMSVKPAEILGVEGGTLRIGAPADVTVADTETEYVIDAKSFLSKGKNTPFHGSRVTGRIVLTVCGGKITFEEKTIW